MSRVINAYAGSNSSLGYYSLFEKILKDLQGIYILKGGPGTGKSTLIQNIGNACMKRGKDVELLHCASDNDSLDGIILPSLKVGIVDGTAPHRIDPKYPGVMDHIVDLGGFCDIRILFEKKEEIIHLTDDMTETFIKAYETFAKARKAHDELEAIYLDAMDFHKADRVTEELIENIFTVNVEPLQNPENKYRFAAAATPRGPKNFYEHLTKNVRKRIIIKGRAGSGKSTMMKKIASHAETLGLDVEYYYCAFDPEAVDMVIIPVLGVAVLDGTAPHIVDPTREKDEVIDMFEHSIDPLVEVRKKEELREAGTSYKYLMQRATNHLAEAKRKRDQLKKHYEAAMDFASVNKRTKSIMNEITVMFD